MTSGLRTALGARRAFPPIGAAQRGQHETLHLLHEIGGGMSDKMSAAEYNATLAGAVAPRGNKYGAEPVEVDGIRFDSKREARRWCDLRLRERAGEIADLERQVVLILHGRDDVLRTRTGRPMRITVDFSYIEVATGLRIYEDAKGKPTRDYEVRRAVAAAQGVEVVEV
jgi:hypothetical protein